jgi:CubicO group peptidase (beta-lactamase class C family)
MRRFLFILLCLSPLAAAAQPAAPCEPPAAANDGWAVAEPSAVGLDAATLCAIGPSFTSWKDANVHAVLVIRHGKLVLERYFTNTDERLGRPLGAVAFNAETLHDLRSITKSVTALVLGIAIGKGEIPGVDEPVLPRLPVYADLRSPEKDRITLRHLLTMSQGLTWDEDIPYSNPANSEIRMDHADDPVRYALAQTVETPSGSVWNYTGGSATIIAALLRKATGQGLDALARTTLFEPLGITDVEWTYLRNGDPAAASGLRLRPRDTAKIGQLVLDHGVWNGKQVVPADWIAAATSPQIAGPGLFFYGYQFWLGRSLVQGRAVDWIAGWGYGGQRLFIVPTLDLVVLVHAGLYASNIQSLVPLRILNHYVLAAVVDGR